MSALISLAGVNSMAITEVNLPTIWIFHQSLAGQVIWIRYRGLSEGWIKYNRVEVLIREAFNGWGQI
ncbi:MAG: hypothetical protein CMI18_11370 [Opitutaceae bacterium]|nr:hypothetical protein [Opitutaceae bacterium]